MPEPSVCGVAGVAGVVGLAGASSSIDSGGGKGSVARAAASGERAVPSLLFILILVLEFWPMITLIRWRRTFSAGESAERLMMSGAGRRIATISHFEALVVVVMVFVAVAMARGFGTAKG